MKKTLAKAKVFLFAHHGPLAHLSRGLSNIKSKNSVVCLVEIVTKKI